MRIFNIFINHRLHQTFRCFVWHLEEDYLLRLGGIQLKLDQDQKLGINPVYYPIFNWKRKPGSRELKVYLGVVAYTFVLSNQGLFVFKSSDTEVEERE
jgi:hypothetical protein